MSARPSHARGERGSVTAEAAVVLPVLLVVLAMAVWVLAAVGASLRCTDAAALAARAAARGESPGAVEAVGRAAAPAGAVVTVRPSGELVEVVVTAVVRPLPGVLGAMPGIDVSGRAVAAREDRVGR